MNKDVLKLYELEKYLESIYIKLIKLEINNNINDEFYNYCLNEINDLGKKELELFNQIIDEYGTSSLKDVLPMPYNKRISELYATYQGDEALNYIEALKYDISKIKLAFLNFMLTTDAYESLKEDLIKFKYEVIYSNMSCEYDLIIQEPSPKTILTNEEAKLEVPSYPYLDKAVLIMEINESLKEVVNITDNTILFKSILDILARLMLCNDELVNYVMPDINEILETNSDISILFNEMLNILDAIKHNITFSR